MHVDRLTERGCCPGNMIGCHRAGLDTDQQGLAGRRQPHEQLQSAQRRRGGQ